MERRLREFDFLRAFAALSVIAIHVTAGLAQSSQTAYLWNQAMRYAVPLFVIMSGFLLYFSEIGRPPLSYPAFLNKRLKKILVPYLIWTAGYVLYSNRHAASAWLAGDGPLIPFLKHLATGTGYVHLYFVLIVLQLYILYPLLKTWLERHPVSLMLAALVLSGGAQTMIYLHQLQVFVLPSLGVPYVSLFPIWLFYFVFGMMAARDKAQWHARLTGKAVPLSALWLVSFALLLADSHVTKTFASSIKPSVMLYCFTSFFFFYALALRAKGTTQKWGNALDWLSTHSFLIFLLHPLLLNLLVVYGGSVSWIARLWSGTDGMILLYLVTTVLTVIVTHFASLVPGVNWIGGVYAGKRPKQPVRAEG
jgi:peptidoglycan/LPS O-acetylase OafA/YrhL